jgi:hypothetical protein
VIRQTRYWYGASSPRLLARVMEDDEKPASRSWARVTNPNCLRLSEANDACLVAMDRSIHLVTKPVCDAGHCQV